MLHSENQWCIFIGLLQRKWVWKMEITLDHWLLSINGLILLSHNPNVDILLTISVYNDAMECSNVSDVCVVSRVIVRRWPFSIWDSYSHFSVTFNSRIQSFLAKSLQIIRICVILLMICLLNLTKNDCKWQMLAPNDLMTLTNIFLISDDQITTWETS